MSLPKGWKTCKLEEVARIIHGVTYKKEDSSQTKKDGYFPIFRANNILNGKINCDELVYVPETFLSNDQWVRIGDIIIVMSSGSKTHVGKTAISTKDYQSGFGAFCAKINVNNNLYNKYLAYYFGSTYFRGYIENICKGTNINNIKRNYIQAHIIPLPPLAEQHRIVAKIEELFAELDRGIAGLEKAKAQLKTYQQAVLKNAFEGTLSHISIESKISIEKIASVSTGTTPSTTNSEYYNNGTIPWVASGALNKTFVTAPTSYVTDKALRETRLKIFPKHTLLVALYGEGKTRGKCSELLIAATINQAIAAINLNEDSKVIRSYLKWFLIKNYQDIRLKSKGGVQPNLNLSKIKKIELPICEIEQQQEIVSAIESRLSLSDSLEKSIDSSLKSAEMLRMSILKKAFAGELVGQDTAEPLTNISRKTMG